MTWGIDQVDGMIFPFHTGRSTGDRDSTFTFQVHVVHRGSVTVTTNFFDFVNPSGVIENALTQRGFTRVDVSTDSDVS